MTGKRPYLVDVPVQLNIWTRRDCQIKQFEVLKQASPSVLIIQSDGGRNDEEWNVIKENRKLFDEGIDWECKVTKVYEEENRGMYYMIHKIRQVVWENVDRCIFLEDDYVPAVSFFRFCAELLEKYKDDQRIEMITGNNVFVEYQEALPNDYFFSEVGWSIWGTATWRDRTTGHEYPLPYENNQYIKNCLKKELSAFWYRKVDGYCSGELVDGHEPGVEYFHAVNSVLQHRLSIIPTRNMICNIGMEGAHAHVSRSNKKEMSFFNQPTFEVTFPMKHPDYVIDDVAFGKMYAKKLGHPQTQAGLFFKRVKYGIRQLLKGQLFATIKRKRSNSLAEK